MPYRKTPLVKDEIYHVFNRGIAEQPIFLSTQDYRRKLQLIDYYRFDEPPVRFSHYNRFDVTRRTSVLDSLYADGKTRVEIYAFCLMPNHYHFLVKQRTDTGISSFIRILQESYAKYFNTKYGRNGSLLEAMFKCVRIENNNQLLHVTRYIHLNPLTSFILKRPAELYNYRWSSFPDYVATPRPFISTEPIIHNFKSTKSFEEFTFDRLEYQRELSRIKHLLLE